MIRPKGIASVVARHGQLTVTFRPRVLGPAGDVSVNEAAQLLGVNRRTMYNRVNRGEIPVRIDRDTGHQRVTVAWVYDQFLQGKGAHRG